MIFVRQFAISRLGTARVARIGLVFLIAWIAIELVLMKLVANRFGWGTTILLHALKGGFGMMLLGWLTMRGLVRLRAGVETGQVAHDAVNGAFAIASAVLIAIPGLAPSLLGIALFSPSLRSWIMRRFALTERPTDPRQIDLDAADWRETRKPRKPRRQIPAKPSLEGEPPSV